MKGLLFVILGGAIEVALTIVRVDLGLSYSMLIGFFIYFIISYITFKKSKEAPPFFLAVLLFLGISAIHLPPRFLDFEGALISLPDYLVHVVGLLSSYLFFVLRSWKKWIPAGLGVFLAFFMFFKGYSMWLHKLNFGTYSGYISSSLPDFLAEDEHGNIISKDSFFNKIVFLDFWHTQCAPCFRKFPVLNELHVKYRDNDKVKFFAFNVPLESDRPAQAFEMIKKRGFTFPVVKLQTKSMIEALSISAFPTAIVINERGEVIFKGSIENGIGLLEKSIKNQAK